jgi:perosamine synthetase
MIPFHRPSIGEEEIAEVVDTLRSGWLTTGRKVAQFEQAFGAYVSAPHAIAVSSGTAALHLALEAIGLSEGDEVILPTYTFTATGEVVTYFRARPVLADCRLDTLNVDVATLEPLVTPRTRAIVPVHVGGQACDMDPIIALARQHGIHVVEDAAHAVSTTYRGTAVGAIGDLTAFSFYATKAITTGEGGMITTRREDLADRLRRMSLHGLSRDAWNRHADSAPWSYEAVEFGFKYNLTDVAAAIGIHQVRRADAMWKRRCQIARAYTSAFAGSDACVPPRQAGYGAHAWHLYILELNLPALSCDRDAVARELRARGIGTSLHFIPLHLHRAYRRAFGYAPGAFPAAEQVAARVLSLPIYPGMTDEDVAQVVQAVHDTLRERKR